MSKNDAIVNKIKNAVNYAKSTTHEDSETAMAMAYRLAAKHNIEMREILTPENPLENYKCMIGFEYGQRIPTEWHYIRVILVEFFNVQTMNCTAGRRREKNYVNFIGTTEDIEIAQFVYNQLYMQFKNLFEQAKVKSNLKTTDKRNYYNGLVRGFYARLMSEKEKIQNEMSLVIVKDPKIEEATNKFYPNTVKKSIAKYDANDLVINRGFNDSDKIQINKGISAGENPSKESSRLLIGVQYAQV